MLTMSVPSGPSRSCYPESTLHFSAPHACSRSHCACAHSCHRPPYRASVTLRKAHLTLQPLPHFLPSVARYFQETVRKATQPGAATPAQTLEITVHCDVLIFEWLLGYINGAVGADAIRPDRVLPLLIASNFLQVRRVTGAWALGAVCSRVYTYVRILMYRFRCQLQEHPATCR